MVNLGVSTGPGELPRGHFPCAECRTVFPRRRHDQVFCSPECRFADHNRAMQRGREIYRMAYHWVMGAGPERRSLINDLSRAARDWRDADREAGRAPPPIPEALQRRVEGARMGYVRKKGRGYVKDVAGAERVMKELQIPQRETMT